MYWLCVSLPELPLEVFQPSDKPVVVVEQQRVLLCNKAASKRGIEAGLNVSTALALAGEVSLVERDAPKERQRLTELAETAYRFSSQVVAYQNRRGDYCLLLEIGASLRLFNGVQGLLEELGAQLANSPLHPNGFTCRFGLANTLKAAELMARSQPAGKASPQNTESNDVQSDSAQSESSTALHKVPVALLDCEAAAIARCEDLGLVYLGDVLALPPAALARRFNTSFGSYLEQLQGKRADPQPWFRPARHFNRELFYIDGLRSHADLQRPMQQLLQAFCQYLQQRQLSCTSIRWGFTRFSKKKHSLRVHLSRAQANYHNLLELSALQLEQLPLDSPVECVALHCQQLLPVEQQHLDLFAKPDNNGDFCLLADKLTGKLGNEALWQPGQHNHHLPEQANAPVIYTPQHVRKASQVLQADGKTAARAPSKKSPARALQPGQAKKTGAASQPQTFPGTQPGQQPSWLLREPLQLEQRGKQVLLQGKPLSLLKGPERLQCNWWSTPASRDYFIAGLARKNQAEGCGEKPASPQWQNPRYSGRYKKPRAKHNGLASENRQHTEQALQWEGFYWVYYDLQARRWYLHGEFA